MKDREGTNHQKTTTLKGLNSTETMEQSRTNFNVAFGLFDSLNNRAMDIADMDGYLQWNIVMFSREGAVEPEQELVSYHVCTEEDWKTNLYSAKESEQALFSIFKPTLVCIDDLSKVRFIGDPYS